MNETTSFTTVPENLVAKPPKIYKQKGSILTLPLMLLLIALFLLIFFTLMYIDSLIFTATFNNRIAYEIIVVASWTFGIATLVIFFFLRFLFLLSHRLKFHSFDDLATYQVVNELPQQSVSTPTGPVLLNQTDSLPLEDSTSPEVPELIAKVKDEVDTALESSPTATTEIQGVSIPVQEIPAEFTSCAAWMDKTLQQQGFNQKQASEFLSLMVYARLLVIADHVAQSAFIQAITGFFASEGAMIDATLPTAPLDQQPLMTSILNSARNKPHVPHMIHLHHVDPVDLPKMLGVFAQYARFPLQSKTLTLDGETYTLPSNLWFIITLKPGTSIFMMPESLRIHAGVYTIKGEQSTEDTLPSFTRVKHDFDWDKASRIFSPTYETKKLSEDLWKKVDQWVALMNQVSGYVLENDVNLHLENYALLGLIFNHDPLVILDQLFASTLLLHALAKAKPTAYQKETDLERFFESAFGRNTFKHSLIVVRQYLKENIH
jgi:hypothetical protein